MGTPVARGGSVVGRTRRRRCSAMATEFHSSRRGRGVVASAVTASALLVLAACSSRNPDALTGLNVDENAAMMDANAAVEANLADANGAPSNAAAANGTSEAQSANSAESAAKATAPKAAEKSRPSREVNAPQDNSASSAELNDVQDNQVSTESDIPNITSND